jgi:ABC-2 type transport system permease protein
MSDPAITLPAAARAMPLCNVMGMTTLVRMELRRYLDGWHYAVLAPVLTTLLFFAVFALALGADRADVMGIPFFHFLAPGLIAMTAMSTAFEAAGWTSIDSKISGTMDVLLSAPLRPGELVAGFLIAAVCLATINALLVAICMQPFVPLLPVAPLEALASLLLGSLLFAVIGLLAGLWASKFDHVATVQNFLVAPAVFLSGAFFPVAGYGGLLSEAMQGNPAFWAIDGVRRGFTTTGESEGWITLPLLALVAVVAVFFARHAVAAGWKIKR